MRLRARRLHSLSYHCAASRIAERVAGGDGTASAATIATVPSAATPSTRCRQASGAAMTASVTASAAAAASTARCCAARSALAASRATLGDGATRAARSAASAAAYAALLASMISPASSRGCCAGAGARTGAGRWSAPPPYITPAGPPVDLELDAKALRLVPELPLPLIILLRDSGFELAAQATPGMTPSTSHSFAWQRRAGLSRDCLLYHTKSHPCLPSRIFV